MTWYAPFED
jgi:hypothetical protein